MPKPLQTLTPKARRTRADIVGAARNIIGQKGIAGLTVMEVCALGRVGRTSFYTYFDGLDALVEAVATSAATGIKERFDRLHEGQPRGRDRLRACLAMLLETAAEDPETMLLMTSLAADDWPVRDMLRHEVLAELSAEARDSAVPVETAADFLTASVLALCRDVARQRLSADATPALAGMLIAAAYGSPAG